MLQGLLGLMLQHKNAARKYARLQIHRNTRTEMQKFQDSFPFEYTDGQKEAIEDILRDMSMTEAMDRLLV